MTDDPAKCRHYGYSCSDHGAQPNPACPCTCEGCQEARETRAVLDAVDKCQILIDRSKDNIRLARAARTILKRSRDRDLARRVMELVK